METIQKPSLSNDYLQVRQATIQASMKNTDVYFYVWFVLDLRKYYADSIPIPMYRERIICVCINGEIMKECYVIPNKEENIETDSASEIIAININGERKPID